MFTDCLAGWDTGHNGEFHWSRLPSVFPPDAKVTLRDNITFQDKDLTYGEFAAYLEQQAPGEDVSSLPLYYGKDLHPPLEWVEATQRNLPKQFLEKEGGDLLACPDNPAFAPETLMTYLGVNGTYTCAHFDLCATLGHNLLLDSDPGPTSIWFMMRSCDHAAASKFWKENGGSLEKDNCFLSWDVLAYAPFPVYVVLQGKGDFVLVSSDGAHQVFNKGRNVKISWNRFPPSCIEAAYWRVLPRYRDVGRSETYRIVGLAYHGMNEWRRLVEAELARGLETDRGKLVLLGRDLGSLLNVIGDFVFQMELNTGDDFWNRVILQPDEFELKEEEEEEEEEAVGKGKEEAEEASPVTTAAVVSVSTDAIHGDSIVLVPSEATAAPASEPNSLPISGDAPQPMDLREELMEVEEEEEELELEQGSASSATPKRRKKRRVRRRPQLTTETDPRKWTRLQEPVTPPEIVSMPEDTLSTVLTCDICFADVFCRFVKCDECERARKACDFCVKCVAEQRGCLEHRHRLRLCELFPLDTIRANY